MNKVKLVAVGDKYVGKSGILYRYTTGIFQNEDIGSFMVHSFTVRTETQDIAVQPIVTGGGEEYNRLRPLAYPNADVFLICFSVDNAATLEHAKHMYVPELAHHCPGIPYLLVGCKTDLRTSQGSSNCVTMEEGQRMAQEIGAVEYVECSALSGDGVAEVLQHAALAGVSRYEQKAKKKCTYM